MSQNFNDLPLPLSANAAFGAGHLLAGQVVGAEVDSAEVSSAEAAAKSERFYSYSPLTDTPLSCHFPEAGATELQLATNAAAAAFYPYSQLSRQNRATFLRAIASEIEALGDLLIDVVTQETALPSARVQGERGRTCQQLRLFAGLLEQPTETVYLAAQPERQPVPAPELRLTDIPLGPVAVFAASNFPLAFSVAGGDTAAALAAGCPVIVKAHNAHPLTSYLVAVAVERARRLVNSTIAATIPAGTFQLLFARMHKVSEQLIQHPVIKAVAFTGSVPLGLHFQRLIQSRPEPIPFYGELGSQNPLLLLPDYARQHSASFAAQLLASVLQGNGQFCTRPGLVFVPKAQLDELLTQLVAGIAATGVATLLTPKIAAGYRTGCAALAAMSGISEVAVGGGGAATIYSSETGSRVLPRLFVTDIALWPQLPELQQEIFGPATVLICYQQLEQLPAVLQSLHGQLTATIYSSDFDLQNPLVSGKAQMLDQQDALPLLWLLAQKAGRLIRNQMPTGVEVCSAMNHGGPYPASTDLRYTAVGSQAVKRFLRPLCRQNLG